MAMASGYRVVVVEDEFLICDMISEVLIENGFQVHSFSNAKAALRHLASGAPCDALFTDINLPGDVDGMELADLARDLRPGIPVVYTSGAATAADVEAVLNSSFVAKPYDPESVCKIVRAFAVLYAQARHVQSAAQLSANQLSAKNSSSQWM